MLKPVPTQIRTFEIIASLALCVFFVKFALGVIWIEVMDYRVSRAKAGLAILAEQMALSKSKEVGRSIASVGENFLPNEGTIGNDPWGNPYAFKYFRNETGDLVVLALVSGGKNSLIETRFTDLNLSQFNGGNYIFNGDDFGFIKKIDNYDK